MWQKGQKEGVGSLLVRHTADQKSPLDQEERNVVNRWSGHSREGAVLRCLGTCWWRRDDTGDVVFSLPSHQFSTVLFKIAHVSVENSSLLIPGLYLDASSLKPPASSLHSCVPDVFTQKSRNLDHHFPLSCLSVSVYLSTSLLDSLSFSGSFSYSPFLCLSLSYIQNRQIKEEIFHLAVKVLYSTYVKRAGSYFQEAGLSTPKLFSLPCAHSCHSCTVFIKVKVLFTSSYDALSEK